MSRLEVHDAEPVEPAPFTADERLEKLKNLWNTELRDEDIKAEFISPDDNVNMVHTPRPKPGKDMRGDDDLRDAAMDALIARGGMVETRELNYSMQQDYMGDDRPPEELARHMPNTAPEKFARDQQVSSVLCRKCVTLLRENVIVQVADSVVERKRRV